MKINLVIERLKVFFNVDTNAALAQKLGVSATTLSNWKNRNTIDYELLFTKCEGANFNWLFLGEGNMTIPYNLVHESPPGYGNIQFNDQERIISSQQDTIEVQRRYIQCLEKDIAKLREEREPVEDGQKRKAV